MCSAYAYWEYSRDLCMFQYDAIYHTFDFEMDSVNIGFVHIHQHAILYVDLKVNICTKSLVHESDSHLASFVRNVVFSRFALAHFLPRHSDDSVLPWVPVFASWFSQTLTCCFLLHYVIHCLLSWTITPSNTLAPTEPRQINLYYNQHTVHAPHFRW